MYCENCFQEELEDYVVDSIGGVFCDERCFEEMGSIGGVFCDECYYSMNFLYHIY